MPHRLVSLHWQDRLQLFQQIEVTLPELSIQKRVVEIITTIQRKIENNQELNDNLEQQAAALFSSLYNRSNTEVRYTDLIQILGGGTPKQAKLRIGTVILLSLLQKMLAHHIHLSQRRLLQKRDFHIAIADYIL